MNCELSISFSIDIYLYFSFDQSVMQCLANEKSVTIPVGKIKIH